MSIDGDRATTAPRTSPAGRAFIARHEGLRTTAYRDPAGVWTIGYGHTAAAGPPTPVAGLTITAAEAEAILARDLATFEAAVARRVTVPLAAHEFDALVSFTFNLGETNLARSTLLRRLNAGDRGGAAAEFGRWNRAGGVVLAGLTRRREAERAMFLGETAAAPGGPRGSADAPASAVGEGPRTTVGAASAWSPPGKPAVASRGVWGGAAAFVAGLVPLAVAAFGLDAATEGDFVAIVAGVGAAAGGALAIWGRLKATRRIG